MARDDGNRAVRSSYINNNLVDLDIYRDRIADLVRSELGLTPVQLTLAQVLEAATWKGGREIAKIKRPKTGGPPIEIESDGTVF